MFRAARLPLRLSANISTTQSALPTFISHSSAVFSFSARPMSIFSAQNPQKSVRKLDTHAQSLFKSLPIRRYGSGDSFSPGLGKISDTIGECFDIMEYIFITHGKITLPLICVAGAAVYYDQTKQYQTIRSFYPDVISNTQECLNNFVGKIPCPLLQELIAGQSLDKQYLILELLSRNNTDLSKDPGLVTQADAKKRLDCMLEASLLVRIKSFQPKGYQAQPFTWAELAKVRPQEKLFLHLLLEQDPNRHEGIDVIPALLTSLKALTTSHTPSHGMKRS